jgi:guanylate kinase
MIQNDELLEHATVYGQHKGIARVQVQPALDSGQDVVLRLDVQGAATIRRLLPEAVLIFLTCESEAALTERLRRRRTESEAALRDRLAIVRQEMDHIAEFDYVVVNFTSHLDETVRAIGAIIKAEKCRVWQREMNL